MPGLDDTAPPIAAWFTSGPGRRKPPGPFNFAMFSELQTHTAEAQTLHAQAAGMDPTAEGNLRGPDGALYTCTPRAANAFELAEVERDLTTHGVNAREILVLTLARTQFGAAPTGWRLKDVTLLYPDERTARVHSVSTGDPLHYALVVFTRQP